MYLSEYLYVTHFSFITTLWGLVLWLAGLGCHLQHQHTVSECSPASTRSTASGEAAEDGLSSWRPVFLVGNRTEVQTFGFYLAYLQTCGYLGSELENGFFSVSFCNLKKKVFWTIVANTFKWTSYRIWTNYMQIAKEIQEHCPHSWPILFSLIFTIRWF